MKSLLSWIAGCCMLISCNNSESSRTEHSMNDDSASMNQSTSNQSTKSQQAEFADARYTDIGKTMLRQFESGDIDSWSNTFADSGTYQWSAGDSLKGKTAIAKYWKERREKVIDSLQFSNDIWFPIKVNTPQKGPDAPGVWLLSWYEVKVKFKNGKKLDFWVHSDLHFNNADKVDVLVHYIDRAPVNKALGMK